MRITVLEASAHGPAQGASGKAGGLVARWAYPKPLVDISFDEHVKLAQEHDGAARWGWRYVEAGQWEGRGISTTTNTEPGANKSLEKTLGVVSKKGHRSSGHPPDLTWVESSLTDSYSPMAGPGDSAQVHPYLFTTSMIALAQDFGAVLLPARATVITQTGGYVTGVTYTDLATGTTAHVPATDVVLCAGAWSPSLLPTLPVSGMRAHSITLRTDAPLAPYVLFTDIVGGGDRSAGTADPEIYARPGGEVYVCGPGDDAPLPDSVDEVVVDEARCDQIRTQASSISQVLGKAEVGVRQACFLPSVDGGGGPIVGAVSGTQGLVVAVGHTCWVCGIYFF